jgi:hypothetical protein
MDRDAIRSRLLDRLRRKQPHATRQDHVVTVDLLTLGTMLKRLRIKAEATMNKTKQS